MALPPGGHVFWRINMAWTILVEGHLMIIFVKLYWNRASGFGEEDFLNLHYEHKSKSGPAPWRPCFLPNQHGLNNFGRGSPEHHFCEIILKSGRWFRRRRFLKFTLCTYKEKWPRPLAAMFFDESTWLEQLCKKVTQASFLWKYIEIGPWVSEKKIFESYAMYI